MRRCRDPETAVSNLWSPGGVRGRLQRVTPVGWQRRAAAAASAAGAGAAAVAAVYPEG